MTGVNQYVSELSGKYLGLLHDLVPKAVAIAALFDRGCEPGKSRKSCYEMRATPQRRSGRNCFSWKRAQPTKSTRNLPVSIGNRQMLVYTSPLFVTRAGQITALAARHRIPAIYARREFAEAGGLMSYGFNVADGYREMGRYAGRILNGEKPADLPFIQPTKFELVINLKAAKAINFEFPPLIRALAGEVIE